MNKKIKRIMMMMIMTMMMTMTAAITATIRAITLMMLMTLKDETVDFVHNLPTASRNGSNTQAHKGTIQCVKHRYVT